MPVIDNALFGEAFSSIELTNAINDIPPEPDALTSEFTWTPTFSQTTSVRINKTEGGAIDIASYTPRDGVPETIVGTKRSAINVEIPGISKRASAMNREALNVTAGVTGAQRLLSLAELRNEKAREMDRSITRAEHRQVAEAIRNLLTNPTPILNGGNPTVILDLLAVLGAQQIECDLDLTDTKKGLNIQIEEIKEISERAIGGSAVVTGFKLISGRNAANAIRQTKDFQELITPNSQARLLAQMDGRKRVPINDNVELIPYKYGYFQPDESFLIPIYEGHAQVVYGPHDAEEFWGNILPRYATTEEMPHGRGVEMEGWAFVLHYFQHPEAIIKVNVIPSV